jgi:hypothetical protein
MEVVRDGRTVQRSEQSSLMSNVGWDDTRLGDRCPPALGALGVFAAGDDSALDELRSGTVVDRLAPHVHGRSLPSGIDFDAFVRVVCAETQGGVFTGP